MKDVFFPLFLLSTARLRIFQKLFSLNLWDAFIRWKTVFNEKPFLLKTGSKIFSIFFLSTVGFKIFQKLFAFRRWVALTTGKQFFIKNVAEKFENSCKQKVAEKSWNQQLKVKNFWKIWKPAVESKRVAENLKISGRKLLSCWKIFKPAVESKKNTDKFENGCKQKDAEKYWNQRLKVKSSEKS